MRTKLLLLLAAALAPALAQPLRPDRLDIHNVKVDPVTYRGRPALRVTDANLEGGDAASRIAIVRDTSFENGTIDVALSGDTLPGAPPAMRGFVGVAFRLSSEGPRFECFYLRPKNGRAEDQLQRNHTTQYISVPGFQWEKLRTESPGKYESYVDLVAGEWTQVKIVVAGDKARLYVNGGGQPVLVVNDLKQRPAPGAVALWVGPGTLAHFADLKIAPVGKN